MPSLFASVIAVLLIVAAAVCALRAVAPLHLPLLSQVRIEMAALLPPLGRSYWMILAAEDLAVLAEPLPPGSGIVKDYVKSRKHEWEQACFIPDLADAVGLTQVVQRFVELQEEFLAGGVVLRSFETFSKPESVAAEVRVWWLDGEPRLLTPHPDGPFERGSVPDLGQIGPAVQRLGCRFVTTDVALRSDGVWRVVEVGDGQVSDLHPSSSRGELAALLVGP
jgi:hypothetical protein